MDAKSLLCKSLFIKASGSEIQEGLMDNKLFVVDVLPLATRNHIQEPSIDGVRTWQRLTPESPQFHKGATLEDSVQKHAWLKRSTKTGNFSVSAFSELPAVFVPFGNQGRWAHMRRRAVMSRVTHRVTYHQERIFVKRHVILTCSGHWSAIQRWPTTVRPITRN